MNEILQSLMDPLTKIFLLGLGSFVLATIINPNLHLFCL